MSDRYSRKRKPLTIRFGSSGYYSRSGRINPIHGYYDELPKRGDNFVLLEPQQNVPFSYGVVVAELEDTRRRFQTVNARLARLETHIPEQKEIRDMPLKQAKKIVEPFLRQYFKKHKQIYPSDVADVLCLKYERVREVFLTLESEGKLRGS